MVLEKDKVAGGLMRSIRHGDFIVDLGRKELYNRLAKVDEFWSALLADDYRIYTHRGGILFDGHIIELSRAYAGVRRGMPWGMFFGCGLDFLWWRLRPYSSGPGNLEEYWYRQRGRRFTQIANQGFQEKLVGRKWADVPISEHLGQGAKESFLSTVREAVYRALWSKETNTYNGIWRHPAKGTGQICEALCRAIVEASGRIDYEARVVGMSASNGIIRAVSTHVGSETITFETESIVSSMPAESLLQLLLPVRAETLSSRQRLSLTRNRVVILVYLFLNEEPRFPHSWLQVTCKKMRVGRIANYSALNSDMVPKGKTALCCEYYCFGEDPLITLDNTQMAELALKECAMSGLVTENKCFDRMVLRLPGADASQNRNNWFSKERQELFAELRQFQNLYLVNRTDLDIATLAGIEAAEAVLSGDRREFDLHFSPIELAIRSESKPLEFRSPSGQPM